MFNTRSCLGRHLSTLTVPTSGNYSHTATCRCPSAINTRLHRVAPLPTHHSESAGLCALKLPRNVIRAAANQWSGLVARGFVIKVYKRHQVG